MAVGTELPPHLVRYWTVGPGGQAIHWNSSGDWQRCVDAVQAAVTKGGKPPLSAHMVEGMCSTLHRIATGGFSPGHAPGEKV